MNNLQTVKEIYEAFGRGEVELILSKMSDSVEWEYSGGSEEVPWLKHRNGKKETAGFFADVNNELEFHKFEPKEFLSGEAVVAVLLDIDLTVRKTGVRVGETDEIHVWRFDDNGKVAKFRHGMDTLQSYRAYVS